MTLNPWPSSLLFPSSVPFHPEHFLPRLLPGVVADFTPLPHWRFQGPFVVWRLPGSCPWFPVQYLFWASIIPHHSCLNTLGSTDMSASSSAPASHASSWFPLLRYSLLQDFCVSLSGKFFPRPLQNVSPAWPPRKTSPITAEVQDSHSTSSSSAFHSTSTTGLVLSSTSLLVSYIG